MGGPILALVIVALAASSGSTNAGQSPGAATAPDIAVSSRDRVYLGEQFSNTISVVDPASNTFVGAIHLGEPQPTGEAAQAVIYVPNAVPQGDGHTNLQPLGAAAMATVLKLSAPGGDSVETSVALFDQGLTQILQAGVSRLAPNTAYVLALADNPQGNPPLESLAEFSTNPAGAAVVNAVGPIRQVVALDVPAPRRYLVIAPVKDGKPGMPVQVQRP